MSLTVKSMLLSLAKLLKKWKMNSLPYTILCQKVKILPALLV